MISVVIPTYNRAKLVPRAIESVLRQTLEDFELLVVDDGSTDNTKEVVEGYARQDKRVTYISQENSGGPARPKNTGIKASKGEYIAILDDDDEWMEDKLLVQFRHFKQSKNPKLRMVGCDMVIVDTETKPVHSASPSETGGEENNYRVLRYANHLRQLLLRDYMGPGSCMLYPKAVFGEVGFFDERLKRGQDRDMRIRIAERFDIEFVDDYLVRYYVGHPGISANADERALEEGWDYLFKKYKNYYIKDKKLWSELLRYEGTRFILSGKITQGRKRFLASLSKNPFNIKAVASLVISFLGKSAYAKIAKYKMKMS